MPAPKKEAMKTELEKMVADEIIIPVSSSQEGWISLHLLVPKDLSTAIKRSHYPLPSLQDVISRLTNAKVF